MATEVLERRFAAIGARVKVIRTARDDSPRLTGGRPRRRGARSFRDRLTGRTSRSERGGRGSSPCPGAIVRGRVAQAEERFSDMEEAAGSTPALPITLGE